MDYEMDFDLEAQYEDRYVSDLDEWETNQVYLDAEGFDWDRGEVY